MNLSRTFPVLLSLFLAFSPILLAGEEETVESFHGQPSWVVRTKEMELAVTQLGGHMAPVTFYRNSDHPVRPYYISPWQEEKLKLDVPVLMPLRGDFFCMPFGGNDEKFKGEKHPPHGETAGGKWIFAGLEKRDDTTTLTLTLQTKFRPGKVTKKLSLVDGQNVIYCQHIIDGFAGPTPLGHHATLAVPEKDGSLRLTTSPFQFGMTNPALFSDPQKGEYQSLQIGQRFTDLSKVPVLWKGEPDADCTSFPARTGFADLLAVFSKPAAELKGPAWVAAVNQEAGYVWFALKDPAVLPATVFWIENHGRHGSPWNGRNRCLGLEDVCAYFADGLVPSAKENDLNKAGIPTVINLSAERPTVVNYIQGAAKIPGGFGKVRRLEFSPGQVVIHSSTGKTVEAPVRYEFLMSGKLK